MDTPSNQLLEIADDLADKVDREWRRSAYRTSEFATAAAAVLAELQARDDLEPADLLRDALQVATSARWRQSRAPGELYLHRDKRFDVCLELRSSSVVGPRSNAPSSASLWLTSPVLFATYRFAPTDALNASLCRGRLTQDSLEVLPAGAILVCPGPEFIYGLCPLSSPALSLSVRSTEATRTYSYQAGSGAPCYWGNGASGLREATSRENTSTAHTTLLALSAHTGRDYESLFAEMVADNDIDVADMYRFARQLGPGRWDSLADALAPKRFADWRESFRTAVYQAAAERVVDAALARVDHVDERLLLALLRLGSDRETVLAMLDAHAGCRDLAQVVQLLGRVVERVGEPFTPSEFDPSVEVILTAMLERPTSEHVLAQLSEVFDPSDVEDMREDIENVVLALGRAPALQVLVPGQT